MIFQRSSDVGIALPMAGIVPSLGLALEAFLLQSFHTERYQAEERVVFAAEEPDSLAQGRAHAPATSAAVTPTAACVHELLMAFFGDLCEVGVGAFQLSLGHLLYQFGRRRRIPSLATSIR